MGWIIFWNKIIIKPVDRQNERTADLDVLLVPNSVLIDYCYSSPSQLRYPQLSYFHGSKKTQVTLFSSFYPRYAPFYVLEEKIVQQGGINTNTNLQHKTNPELRYFGSYTIFK